VELGVPVWSPDVLNDHALAIPAAMRTRIEASGNRAVLAVPMHAKGDLIGVISIADGAVRDFADAEVALLQALGDQAALAIENARLYQTTQRAFEELSQTQAQLVRGETLRAMGELAAGVAHHLNNLLAVVLGRVQLALARGPEPDLVRHLELAERAALDGADVVRRMRDFARAQPVANVVSVDLNQVAAEVLELTRPRWHDAAQVRGIRIETRLEAGAITPVAGDVAALREVFMNLILNAIEALPEGGVITVRTWQDGSSVHCEVADTGVGMSPEVQRRALEPFFTTKGFQSTGLGLSVNYGIVRRHGGDLGLTSAPGEGTRVTFRLPVAAPSAPEPPVVPMPMTASLRILVIDDEPEVRHVVAEMLANQGHEVVVADDGQAALARLESEGAFDLVLTDLGMPGMTGWDVARAVKSRRPDMPVGLLTGWGEQPAAKPEDRWTADFVLAKPITVDGLRAALSRVRAKR
jgi:signal transduction histidine kinase/CheY-like chemotaxis protein